MVLPKIEERTLYPPIVNYLKEIGFHAFGESTLTNKHPDIIFSSDSISFVIEIKIGKPEVGSKAVAQAYDYATKLGTNNIIILIYPEEIRNPTILDSDFITKIALDQEIHTIVLTEYLTESTKTNPRMLFDKLENQIELDQRKIDFDSIVSLIGAYVKDLYYVIQQIKTDYIITEVVDKLDLFSSIGEFKNENAARKQVLNLAAYLLFNQILFYHIYHQKTKSVEELDTINQIKDLQKYFDIITKIDYQSIYKMNLTGHIPNNKTVIQILNDIIKSIKILRVEHVSHDLAGRFFHDLIPYEVRKILAAFYTHPIAADLLAGLTIDSFDETIIDPACGSGTLLVSSYNLKMKYYKRLFGFKEINSIHKQFIENDLTGNRYNAFC